MAKIFDINNPVWTFMAKMVDVFVLHFLWFICCLPIVTAGPATIALYYSMMKTVKDDNPHYVRSFFKSFKQNMKQGIPMGLLFLVFGVLLAYSIWFYIQVGKEDTGSVWRLLKGVTIGFTVIFLFIAEYAFPLMARFENTVMQTIKNAFFLSIKHLGRSILMIIIFVVPYAVILFTNFLPLLAMAFGLVVFFDSYILNKIFEPFIKEALGEQADEDPDHWVIDDEVLPERIEENTEESPEEPGSEE